MISKGRVIRTGIFFALANFAVAASLGSVLRYNSLFPIIDFQTRYWIHAHSHVAFLGWVFTALATLAYAMLLPKGSSINRKVYRLIIYAQIAVTGMLVTFPFMGYAAPSIFFSTFHLVLTFIFVVLFFKNAPKNDLPVKMMKAALVFMLVSGIGPLALGPIMVMGFKGTPMYDMAIYFYLHFQYNGWFTLAVFALLIKLAEDHGLLIDQRTGKIFYRLMVYSAILTLALSALGFGEDFYALSVGMIGAILQLAAGFFMLRFIFQNRSKLLSGENSWAKAFISIALLSWIVKILMQFSSAFPIVTDFAYVNREAIMTYLHLTFLGFASFALIGIFISKKYLSDRGKIVKTAYGFFMITIVLMLLTIGIKAMPQLLTVELFNFINYALFAEGVIIFLSVSVILLFGFVLRKNEQSS